MLNTQCINTDSNTCQVYFPRKYVHKQGIVGTPKAHIILLSGDTSMGLHGAHSELAKIVPKPSFAIDSGLISDTVLASFWLDFPTLKGEVC